jgi:2-oxoacid:acceptor oxidoreductase gamma subunit (pyruvate/2-ketoisovalerate family)
LNKIFLQILILVPTRFLDTKEEALLKDSLMEIRFHGRGGQGAWTASQLLAYGGLKEKKYVQSFPTFGPEREGAPVQAFTRISDEPIIIHSMVYEPEIVVVLDSTLLGPEVVEGVNSETVLVVNTEGSPQQVKEDLGLMENDVWVVNATELAMKILGRPITNTAVLGALLKARSVIELESLLEAIKERFPERLRERNMRLVQEAYREARNR